MPISLIDLPKYLMTEISQYLSVKELCQLKSTATFFQPSVNEVLIKRFQAQQIKQMAAGSEHTVFLQQNGSVWACGHDIFSNTDDQISPCKLPLDDVQHVVTGGIHTLFVKTDGSIWAFGYNLRG